MIYFCFLNNMYLYLVLDTIISIKENSLSDLQKYLCITMEKFQCEAQVLRAKSQSYSTCIWIYYFEAQFVTLGHFVAATSCLIPCTEYFGLSVGNSILFEDSSS
jgi:hypothetical protein